MFSRIATLPLWAKVLLAFAALIALGLAIVLSPFMIIVTIIVLIIAIFALIYRLLRRRSLRKWGIVALTSLLLLPIFAGGTLALYSSGASRQASSPSEQKEAVNQREPSVEEVEKEADPSEK